MSNERRRTLVTFLGTGNYGQTSYYWGDSEAVTTAFASCAMAQLWRADAVVVLATEQAQQVNGAALAEALTSVGCPAPRFEVVPDGRDEGELWQHFDRLQQVMAGLAEDAVLLDITHGFRAQPFFAAAGLSVLRAVGQQPTELQVAYGEYRSQEATSPIWDLSLFNEVVDWANALGIFLRTGSSDAVVSLAEASRRREARRVSAEGGRDFPQFQSLVSAIEGFSDDLATVRIASLITGYAQSDERKPQAQGSAARLLAAIADCREEVRAKLPPLALVLDQLETAVQPLVADALFSERGQHAQKALARYYHDLGRYPEAATVVREARVNQHASGSDAVEVNSAGFRYAARQEADRRFGLNDPHAADLGAIRNDLGHGGYRRQPLAADALRRQVAALTERVDEPAPSAPAGRTVFVGRHPGAEAWVERQGYAIDDWVAHLEVDSLNWGDTVIGTLPLNKAAEVCQKGARYYHLAIDLPSEWRGVELNADELDACGARLQAFHVRAV